MWDVWRCLFQVSMHFYFKLYGSCTRCRPTLLKRVCRKQCSSRTRPQVVASGSAFPEILADESLVSSLPPGRPQLVTVLTRYAFLQYIPCTVSLCTCRGPRFMALFILCSYAQLAGVCSSPRLRFVITSRDPTSVILLRSSSVLLCATWQCRAAGRARFARSHSQSGHMLGRSPMYSRFGRGTIHARRHCG